MFRPVERGVSSVVLEFDFIGSAKAMTPQISVIIAAYKAEQFLPSAIASCQAQTLADLEVLVIDDASPEPLRAVTEAAADGDARVKYFRLEENQGPAAARNFALDRAEGRFVAILDADDLMAPDRLSALLTIAEEKQADIVADNMIAFQDGDDIDHTRTPYFDLPEHQPTLEIALSDLMQSGLSQFGNSLGYSKPIIRRRTVEQSGLRYATNLRNSEDYYFLAGLLASRARMMLVAEPRYFYRRHESSLSHRMTPEIADQVALAEVEFRTKYIGDLTAVEQSISLRRERDAIEAARFERIRLNLLKGEIGSALKRLAARPIAAPRHVSKLFKVAVQKL